MRPASTLEGMDLVSLADLLRGRSAVVLAGAGCSTESGIPDYRGPEGRIRKRPPVQYGDFVRTPSARTRYWARSAIGWSRMADARPNPAHVALARLEEAGRVRGVITQNVDGLHHAAGSRAVVELHGSLAQVRCLSCGGLTSRADVQDRILEENAVWIGEVLGARGAGGPEAAPDGDAEIPDEAYASFVVPSCRPCGGLLKPDVVFFGENVPKARVDAAWRLVDRSDVLVVVGSSLTVFSGRRFVYGARDRGMPVAVVNLGPTRADELASVKVEGRLGDVLPRLVDALTR